MTLTELTPISAADLPIADFKDHLRLGTGFADSSVQDTVLEQSLRAAIASVEARTAKSLLLRQFKVTLHHWRDPGHIVLPVAPALSIDSFQVFGLDGSVTDKAVGDYIVRPDAHGPEVWPLVGCLPALPTGGWAEIDFSAGFASEWAAIPADLKQAVFYLAADFHENRHDGSDKAAIPARVQQLLSAFRPVRISGGRR